jgi:aspartyl-tRNA(Asn)/glutamyl-tRNA(Gln) amidotransferase subunit C
MDIQELVETVALAHLDTGRDDLVIALPAFEQMLGFFAVMQEADRDAAFNALVPPLAPGQAAARLVDAAHFRGDAEAETGLAGERLLEAAGERDGRFIVIPNVL